MTPIQWELAEKAYLQVLGTDAARRDEELDRICGNEQQVRDALVEDLLRVSPSNADSLLPPGPFNIQMLASTIPSALQEIDPPEIPGYDLLRVVGKGGQGVVYQALQETTGQIVAIKVLTDSRLADRFRREVDVLGQLRHANLVKVFDAGVADGRPYYVMEFVEGQSMEEYVAASARPEGGMADVQAAVQQFREICAAVDAAHRQDVIHRDLKPGNIRIDADGVPRVLDFGLARILSQDTSDTVEGFLLGTAAWASPEQAAGQNSAVSRRTDVYALGLLLYWMLTGRGPYDLPDAYEPALAVIQTAEPFRPSRFRPLDAGLERIILTCLEKDPDHRFYHTAGEVADDVQRWLQGQTPVVPGLVWRYRTGRLLRRNRVLIGVAAVVLLAGVLIGVASDRADRARAEALFARGNDESLYSPKQAVDTYRAALDLNPGLDDARLDLAMVLIRIGRLVDAEDVLQEMLDRSEDARAHLLLGRLLRNEHADRADEHTKTGERLLDRAQPNWRYHLARGTANDEEAVRWLLEYEPPTDDFHRMQRMALIERANRYVSLQDVDALRELAPELVESFEEATKGEGEWASLLLLGIVTQMTCDDGDAACLQKALDVFVRADEFDEGDSWMTAYYLGACYTELAPHDSTAYMKANEWCDTVENRSPLNPFVNRLRSVLFYRWGVQYTNFAKIHKAPEHLPVAISQLDRALQYEKAALVSDKAFDDDVLEKILFERGQTYYALADYEEDDARRKAYLERSVADLKQVVKWAGAMQPFALERSGTVLMELGRYAEARQSLERSVAADAKMLVGWHNLGRLDLLEGEVEAALDHHGQAVELARQDPLKWGPPGERTALIGDGLAAWAGGDLDGAVVSFDRVLRINDQTGQHDLALVALWIWHIERLRGTPDADAIFDNYDPGAVGGVAETALDVMAERGALAADVFEGIVGERKNAMCEAAYCLGATAEVEGRLDDAVASYRACLETKRVGNFEYLIALQRLRVLEAE